MKIIVAIVLLVFVAAIPGKRESKDPLRRLDISVDSLNNKSDSLLYQIKNVKP